MKKPIPVKKAVFIGVEDKAGGIGDLFIAYLKIRFRSESVNVKYKACKGGSYKDMAQRAARAAANDAWDLCLILWDSDRAEEGDKPQPPVGFEARFFTPCIEGDLLVLLEKKHPSKSKGCKSMLEKIARLDQGDKMKKLLQDIADAKFHKHLCLGALVHLIQTGALPES